MDADVLKTVGIIGGLIFSVAFHESAHAWMAYRLGDPTGKLLGRLTLNPIPHIDLFGTLILPIGLWVITNGGFTFGYAKPVPYDPRYLKHPVAGSALISAAGPVSNLLLCVICVIAVVILARVESVRDTAGIDVLYALGWVNLSLAIFNLVPIPPLDGSGVVALLLPARAREAYLRIGAFGFIIVMVLLQIPEVSRLLLKIKLDVFYRLVLLAEGIFG